MPNFLKVFTAKLTEKEQKEYLNFVNEFRNPAENGSRFGQNFSDIIEYDLISDTGENEVGGHLEKRFIRLYKGYFSDLINEIKNNPNCSYVSFLNEEDVEAEEIMPKNFSVLLKKIKNRNSLDTHTERLQINSELLSSRILNYFGAQTVFNQAIVDDFDFYVASVDFLKPHEKFYSADEFLPDNYFYSTLRIKDTLQTIIDKVELICETIHFHQKRKPKVNFKQIQENYIKDYLTRILFLGDMDFSDKNYGFVYNAKKNRITNAPNFDFELAFNKLPKNTGFVFENLCFIQQEFPKVFDSFFESLKSFTSLNHTGNPLYVEFVDHYVQDEDLKEEFSMFIEMSSSSLLEMYTKIKEQGSFGPQK